MLIVLSALAYVLTAAICGGAALSARRSPAPGWHIWFWTGAALFFVFLALMRIDGTEDILRSSLRHDLSEASAYGRRRAPQKVVAGIVMLGALAAVIMLVRAWLISRRTVLRRAIVAATAGLGGMAALVTLRIVSFHPTDWLLHGPLHLNWIADPATTLLVAAAGWSYRRETRERMAA
jgi:hypothetical protein